MRLTLTLAILLSCVSQVLAQPPVTTIVGTSACGYSGDGGPAAQAQICNPLSAVADGQGGFFFIDAANYRIRRVTASGVITTIAGNGTRGSSGDGGPAVNANLGAIQQIAFDGANIWFGDPDEHKLRVVNVANGTINGYGTGNPVSAGDGGSITGASFHEPSGIALIEANSGNEVWFNFYLSDSADNLVRLINGSTGIVSTVVGPGTGVLGDDGPGTGASLSNPITLGSLNNLLFIADSGNNRIRRFDPNANVITTVAGNGTAGYSGDGGSASSAQMNAPGSVTADATGNLYIGDSGNFVVREVYASSGNIGTIAGNGISAVGVDNVPATQTSLLGVNGAAWDPFATRLLISDASNRIRQVNYGMTISASPNPAQMGNPVTFTATVASTFATGSVTFTLYGPGTTLGTVALSGGQAVVSWTPTSAGTLNVYASYGGDANDPAENSLISIAVPQVTTSIGLTSSANPGVYWQPVTFTATVTPSTTPGSITFNLYNGGRLYDAGNGPAGERSGGADYLHVECFLHE